MLEIFKEISSVITNGSHILKDVETRKRLFLLECRTNLSIINMIPLNISNKDLQTYVTQLLPTLNIEMSKLLLSHFKNDFLSQISSTISFEEIEDEEILLHNDPKDILIQIISKVETLKIICLLIEKPLPIEHINLKIRLKNLKKVLLLGLDLRA